MTLPSVESKPPPPTGQHLVLLRGLAGGFVGGIAGYLLFWWMARQGFYSSMVPGILLGLGAGFAARGRSQTLGIICLIAAIPLTLFSEWHVMRYVDTFPYFVAHLYLLKPIKLIMMALGVAGAYWFGQGR